MRRYSVLLLLDISYLLTSATCRYWMQKFPIHFDSDSDLYEAVSRFKRDLCNVDINLCSILETCESLDACPFIQSIELPSFSNHMELHSMLVDCTTI